MSRNSEQNLVIMETMKVSNTFTITVQSYIGTNFVKFFSGYYNAYINPSAMKYYNIS